MMYRNRQAMADFYAQQEKKEAEERAKREAEEAARIEAKEKADAERRAAMAEEMKKLNAFQARQDKIYQKAAAEKVLRFNADTGKAVMVPNTKTGGAICSDITAAMRNGAPVIEVPTACIKDAALDMDAFTQATGTLCDAGGMLRDAPKYDPTIRRVDDPPFVIPKGVAIYTSGDAGLYALVGDRLLLCTNQVGLPIPKGAEGYKAKAERLAREEAERKAKEEAERKAAEEEAERERQARNMKTLSELPQGMFDKLMSMLK